MVSLNLQNLRCTGLSSGRLYREHCGDLRRRESQKAANDKWGICAYIEHRHLRTRAVLEPVTKPFPDSEGASPVRDAGLNEVAGATD